MVLVMVHMARAQGWTMTPGTGLTTQTWRCCTGVRAGSAPPPATASAARPGEEEDEEGMDEPPEVKQFLQELGEGGRATPEPGLPEDGLPASGASLPSWCMRRYSLLLYCMMVRGSHCRL